MNVRLTMAAATSYMVNVSTLLEATTAHVTRDTNFKKTVNSSAKVSRMVKFKISHVDYYNINVF